MPQVFVAPEDLTKDSFVVRGREAHHLIRVLRKKADDEIDLFDGRSSQFTGRLTSINSSANEVRGVILKTKDQPERLHTVVLYQGLPRGAKFDYVIEKATELGVDVIVPVLSKKNPVQVSLEKMGTKVPRWERVAKASAKQCNRADVPTVEAPRELKDLAPHLKNGLSVFLWEKEKHQTLKRILRVAAASHSTINLIIGPESGFTSEEASFLESSGAFPVTLGKRILRTETTGLAVLSILNYELGLF